MLRLLGHRASSGDGISRRTAIAVGGLSLFGSVTQTRLLAATERSVVVRPGRAKSVVLLNLFGGPPHQDLFDLKTAAPVEVRGEFKPINTVVPGLQIGELLPELAQVMDRCSLIRSYSHKYNSHNPYNVYTGFDGGNDRENYFAKRTDHPSMASVAQHVGLGATDVPPYVILPAYPGYSQALRRAGPYGGYLGSQYDPLFTMWEKQFQEKGSFYKPVNAYGTPVLPSLDSLPDVTADRLNRRRSLLDQFDQSLAATDKARMVESMGHFQQKAFTLLTSSKTRSAFDISDESPAMRELYGRTVWGDSMLICRRLVERGSTFVSVNWEEESSGNHWDLHENNFGMCRVLAPTMDRVASAMIRDLEQRGLLDSTLVVVMGEMGRTPRINGRSGRDHWPQCGFVLLAGAGLKRGFVLGRTDEQAAYPVERPVSAGDLVATIYELLGVDPHMTVDDLTGRPNHIAHGGEPVRELYAS